MNRLKACKDIKMAKKKTKMSKPLNFVAKYAHQFNRAVTFADKTKYNRKGRSKGLPFDFQLVISA